MKILNLSQKAWNKINSKNFDLYETDFEDSIKSCLPGEWVTLTHKNLKASLLAYINPMVEKGPIARILNETNVDEFSTEEEVAKEYLSSKIKDAINYRCLMNLKTSSCRLIFGQADGLPGLIVDSYKNVVLVQINTAGIDRYRSFILDTLRESIPDQNVLAFDQKKYRQSEGLPVYELEKEFPEIIQIHDNGFEIEMPFSQLQKVGYYYDHCENRLKLEHYLRNYNKKLKTGLDLFCYVGTWGMHLLRAGVEKVYFIDQANMKDIVDDNLSRNNFEAKGEFFREDVFKYLDNASRNSLKFDIIVSDPPAFSKEDKNRKKAILGYERLHANCLELLNENSLFIAASCTHGVSLEELDMTVNRAASKKKREIKMLDIGIQGRDHVFSSLKDKNTYIKYILYHVK